MTTKSNQIVFFGSGPVAAQSLSDLLGDFSFEAVITKLGDRKNPNPVESLAQEHGLKLYNAINKSELDEIFITNHFNSRLGLVIDYGIIISSEVIASFELGILNSHFSLLPQWRGADPITFAILSGQPTTGVSIMLINEKLDEGPLLCQKDYPIPPDSTSPELTSDLIGLSGELLRSIVPKYFDGAVRPYPQDPSNKPSYSRKLTKDDGRIDWHKSAQQIEREIRAFADWPKSYTTLAGVEIVITKAAVANKNGNPGEIDHTDRKRLVIYCEQDAIDILRLKPSGKPEMDVTAFLAGYRPFLS
jgi:methionyl-tRNA formyltransferase